MRLLAGLLEELPQELARQVFTHASWSEHRGDSYARLAFLGDSVLALSVTAHLYPRLEAERFGRDGRGGDRRLLPACRIRAHRRGGRGGLRARDRAGAGEPSGLQVRAAG